MKLILVRTFGISTRISLNSFIKGGSTSKTEARNKRVRKIKTNKRDNGLGNLKVHLILLVKLQIMLEITKEQIMRRKKSLRLQNIRKKMPRTNILKKSELFNF